MVPRFSSLGSAQLGTDTSYLINVFEGLGLRAHPLLQHVHFLANCTNEELQVRINAGSKGRGTKKLIQRFDGAFGRARGLAMPMERQ
eukprot:580781-Prorocentrum_lima.AAC.1